MKRYFLLMMALVLFGCGGNGTTSVGNPTDAVITIGRLSATGTSTITMPLAVFGDSESDLSGASVDITKNGEALTSGLDPATYYNSSIEAVRFVLSGLVDGDELAFVITLSGGTSETYEGTVSDEADAEATPDEESSAGSIRPTEDGFMIYTDILSAYEGIYVPTTGSCFRDDGSDYEALYVVGYAGDVLVDFLEDNAEADVDYSNSSTTGFTADIENTDDPSFEEYQYTVTCQYAFSGAAISGSCEVTEVDLDWEYADEMMGTTCEIGYAKCSGLDEDDYLNASPLHAGYSTAAELEALDACYAAN